VKGREAILKIHTRDRETVGQRRPAGRWRCGRPGLPARTSRTSVNEAALLAARRDKLAVERSDFNEAIDRVIAGLEKKSAMNPRVRRIVAYHESGHAIRGHAPAGPRSRAQGLDRPPGSRRARLHDADSD
jgi:cell division protease FtsH